MVRLLLVTLFVAVVATLGWSQSTGPVAQLSLSQSWRIGETGTEQSQFAGNPEDRMLADAEVSSNSSLGLGLYGSKRDKTALPPVTVYDVNTRQTRRAGVGFRLKF
jgi:hypothetical protein